MGDYHRNLGPTTGTSEGSGDLGAVGLKGPPGPRGGVFGGDAGESAFPAFLSIQVGLLGFELGGGAGSERSGPGVARGPGGSSNTCLR
jgi:hypothetical protein